MEEELVRIRLKEAEKKDADDADGAFQKAFPFIFEHAKYLRDCCRKGSDKRRPYPGHSPYDAANIHRRYYYLLMSMVGETPWAYLVKILGFPSWRTIQVWRADLLAQMGIDKDVFDGSEENLGKLLEVIGKVLRDTGHPEWMKGTVACDAVAATGSVSVGQDGTVTGLKEPMVLSPEERAPLLDARGEAFVRFVAKMHKEGRVALYMHVISFISVVPGVSSMVLQVIPAHHGKATTA